MKRILLVLSVILFSLNSESQNENFEDGSLTNPTSPSTIVIATPNAVNGWTVNGGSNSAWGANGNCTNTIALTGAPNAAVLISPGAAGHIDAIIGAGYPIYSVYGNTTTTYPGATAVNGFQCYGDWFLKLNNQTPGASVNRISKTIMVTPANSLLQFATMSVIEGSHCCCDNPGFSLKLKVGCGPSPTFTSCPSFSASPPALAACTPSGSCSTPGNATSYSVSVVNPAWSYSKWKLNTIDLSSFIGNCVTVELTSFDCPYSAHAGYTYFDAQSSPLDIIVNGNAFPAGTPIVNVSHCGSGSFATITAPQVVGGYTWTCPGPYTIAPASGTITAGQQIYTGITGNHTLTMNPPGSCSPIIRVINLMLSPAPNMIIPTFTQSSCTNFNNGISVMMSSGTATNNFSIPQYTVVFSPAYPTGTVGVSANTATYTGLSVGINTITIIDSVGCKATQTINIAPPPVIPTFSIDAPNGVVVGCVPPTVPLNAINTNTAISGMTYTWTSSTQPTSVTASYNGYGNTTYTVFGSALGTCVSVQTITVYQSSVVPTVSVSLFTQSLTCNGACKTFTAVTSTTTNIIGAWYNSSGQISPFSTTPLIMCANAPGTYTAQFCSTISGCCSQQTVAVTSNTTVPTITVTPTTFNGYTINCTNPKVVMNVNTNSIAGPFGYTFTPLPSGFPFISPTGSYTVIVPGQYEVKFTDGYACSVTQTITVFIDTLRPSPLSITNLPSNSYTLNCYTPTLIATGITNPMLPVSNYSWTMPPSITIPSNTISLSLANIT